jgi:hypothetical protein
MDYFSGQIPVKTANLDTLMIEQESKFQPGGQGQSAMKNIGSWNWKDLSIFLITSSMLAGRSSAHISKRSFFLSKLPAGGISIG